MAGLWHAGHSPGTNKLRFIAGAELVPDKGAPHLLQNLSPSVKVYPHDVQFIFFPLIPMNTYVNNYMDFFVQVQSDKGEYP